MIDVQDIAELSSDGYLDLLRKVIDACNAQEEQILGLIHEIDDLKRKLNRHAGPRHAEPDLRGLW